jgi:hypothetical protein
MKPTGLILAAVLIVGCAVANANVTSNSASLVSVYDDFRTDGPLLSAATGQHWILDGHGKLTASVRGGQLVAGRRGTIRAGLDFGSPVQWIDGTFELSDGPAPVDRSVVMLAMVLDRGPITLQNLVHLIISPTMWALQKRIDGGDFVPILQGSAGCSGPSSLISVRPMIG